MTVAATLPPHHERSVMKPITRIGAAAATAGIALLAVTACGSDESSSADSATSAPSTSSTESAAPTGEASASSGASAPAAEPVVITIKGFAYSGPGTVAPGTEITVKNDDDAAHTVTADGKGGFDVILQPGTSATFKAPAEPGKYDFHCTYHADMHGSLTVG